jgi:acyl dehydratase
MLDRSRIGHVFPPFQVELEKGRLRLFAKAIGETNPVYLDEDAARAAGYRSLLMPPTYPFCLGKDIPDPFDTLNLFGLDFAEILHGEQSFRYHAQACAGDTLSGRKRVADIYSRKNGALEFIVVMTDFRDRDNILVCEATQTIVVKQQALQ